MRKRIPTETVTYANWLAQNPALTAINPLEMRVPELRPKGPAVDDDRAHGYLGTTQFEYWPPLFLRASDSRWGQWMKAARSPPRGFRFSPH